MVFCRSGQLRQASNRWRTWGLGRAESTFRRHAGWEADWNVDAVRVIWIPQSAERHIGPAPASGWISAGLGGEGPGPAG
jgi:hypothetical protein